MLAPDEAREVRERLLGVGDGRPFVRVAPAARAARKADEARRVGVRQTIPREALREVVGRVPRLPLLPHRDVHHAVAHRDGEGDGPRQRDSAQATVKLRIVGVGGTQTRLRIVHEPREADRVPVAAIDVAAEAVGVGGLAVDVVGISVPRRIVRGRQEEGKALGPGRLAGPPVLGRRPGEGEVEGRSLREHVPRVEGGVALLSTVIGEDEVAVVVHIRDMSRTPFRHIAPPAQNPGLRVRPRLQRRARTFQERLPRNHERRAVTERDLRRRALPARVGVPRRRVAGQAHRAREPLGSLERRRDERARAREGIGGIGGGALERRAGGNLDRAREVVGEPSREVRPHRARARHREGGVRAEVRRRGARIGAEFDLAVKAGKARRVDRKRARADREHRARAARHRASERGRLAGGERQRLAVFQRERRAGGEVEARERDALPEGVAARQVSRPAEHLARQADGHAVLPREFAVEEIQCVEAARKRARRPHRLALGVLEPLLAVQVDLPEVVGVEARPDLLILRHQEERPRPRHVGVLPLPGGGEPDVGQRKGLLLREDGEDAVRLHRLVEPRPDRLEVRVGRVRRPDVLDLVLGSPACEDEDAVALGRRTLHDARTRAGGNRDGAERAGGLPVAVAREHRLARRHDDAARMETRRGAESQGSRARLFKGRSLVHRHGERGGGGHVEREVRPLALHAHRAREVRRRGKRGRRGKHGVIARAGRGVPFPVRVRRPLAVASRTRPCRRHRGTGAQRRRQHAYALDLHGNHPSKLQISVSTMAIG